MTTFEQRERAYENKFVHEQDLIFKARAARNHRIAIWAAEQMRIPSGVWADYAEDIVRCGAEGGDEAVVQRVRADFHAAGVHLSGRRLDGLMAAWLGDAMQANYPPVTQKTLARPARPPARSAGDKAAFPILPRPIAVEPPENASLRTRAAIATAAILSFAFGLVLLGNTLSLWAPYDSALEFESAAAVLASLAAGVWASS